MRNEIGEILQETVKTRCSVRTLGASNIIISLQFLSAIVESCVGTAGVHTYAHTQRAECCVGLLTWVFLLCGEFQAFGLDCWMCWLHVLHNWIRLLFVFVHDGSGEERNDVCSPAL